MPSAACDGAGRRPARPRLRCQRRYAGVVALERASTQRDHAEMVADCGARVARAGTARLSILLRCVIVVMSSLVACNRKIGTTLSGRSMTACDLESKECRRLDRRYRKFAGTNLSVTGH